MDSEITSVNRPFVLALTAVALANPLTSMRSSTIVAEALSRGHVDEDALFSILLLINKVVLKWATQVGWARVKITDPACAATLTSLLAQGSSAYTQSLRVLRSLMDWLLQYSTLVVCEELGAWAVQVGFASALEMLQRDEHCASERSQMVTSVWTCSQSLLVVIKVMIGNVTRNARASTPPFSTILAASTSLSGTLRKIVGRVERGDSLDWNDLDCRHLSEATNLLCDTNHLLLFLHTIGDDTVTQGGDTGPRGSLNAILRLAQLLHMSAQGLLRTLLRARGPGAEFRQAVSYCEGRDLGQLDDPARTHRLYNALHGRLLPGCCNPTCDNLSGVGEAALPTRLCSGCRRVRYCSLWCQKEDRHAGHRNDCSSNGTRPW